MVRIQSPPAFGLVAKDNTLSVGGRGAFMDNYEI
jgi:hypothetical protein